MGFCSYSPSAGEFKHSSFCMSRATFFCFHKHLNAKSPGIMDWTASEVQCTQPGHWINTHTPRGRQLWSCNLLKHLLHTLGDGGSGPAGSVLVFWTVRNYKSLKKLLVIYLYIHSFQSEQYRCLSMEGLFVSDWPGKKTCAPKHMGFNELPDVFLLFYSFQVCRGLAKQTELNDFLLDVSK